MILFSSISGFVNGIAVIIFGLLVLLHNPKNKANRLMALKGGEKWLAQF